MADANEQPVITQPAGDAEKDDLIPRAEAKKAFEARDRAKKEADELRKRALSEDAFAEYQALKAEREKAEEDRQKKAGEFESIKKSLIDKHTTELESERRARLALEQSYTQEKIEAAFLGASEWFGGETAKTIMTGDMAYAYLGKHVGYEEVDVAGKTIKAIVVRDLDGNIILDGKGNPARFAEAISELIQSLPNKDRILRGSGKTGSGSSGGSTRGSEQVDLSRLNVDSFKDPKVRAALKQRQAAAGGLQMGPAFDRTR
jgi:hypothetical protein